MAFVTGLLASKRRAGLLASKRRAGGAGVDDVAVSPPGGGPVLEPVFRDAALSLRLLVKHPKFVLPAVAIIALGIALSASLFAIVDAVLFRSLPFADADRLVLARADHTARGGRIWSIDRRVFRMLRETSTSLDALEGQFGYPVTIEGDGGAQSVEAARVTGGMFALLGVRPLLGRWIEEGDRGVVVLSHALWQSAYGADPDIVGKRLRLDDLNPRLDATVAAGATESFTVVGVMPQGFTFPADVLSPAYDAAVWIPFHLDEAIHRDGAGAIIALGRLSSGHTIADVRAEQSAVMETLREAFPEDYEDVRAHVISLHEIMVGSVRGSLQLLLGGAGFLLLVVVSNVANLFVTRALLRSGELSLRRALGAGRAHLYRLAFCECLAVCLIGAAAGLAAAVWLLPLMIARAPATVPRLAEAAIDVRVGVIVALFVTACSLVFSAAATRASLGDRAPARSRWQVAGGRVHALPVLAQVAITVLLLSGSLLMFASIDNLARIEGGFDTEGRLFFSLFLPQSRYPDDAAKIAVTDELYPRLEAIPGVVAVGGSDQVPPVRFSGMNPFVSAQHPEPLRAGLRTVTRNYPLAAGLRLVAGRMFDSRDHYESQRVVIVTEATAEAFFPDGQVLGQEIWIDGYPPWGRARVVGVFETVATYFADGLIVPEVYQLHEQDPWNQQRVLVRVTGDPGRYGDAIRRTVAAVDPMLPVNRLRPLSDNVARAMAPTRFLADLLGVFALTGLVLAAVGIFGVMSFAVAQSSREMALRLAIGASPPEIIGLILSRAAWLTAAGAALGGVGAFVLARALRSSLYDVSPGDPVTLGLSAGVVAVVALASTLPAGLRAARVDPADTLRNG